MKNKDIIKAALQNLLTNTEIDLKKTVSDYFSHNYHQIVNGKHLPYRDFINHMQLLHQIIKSLDIEFVAIAENENTVFTHHHIRAVKYNHEKIHIQVMAQFTLERGKIIQCNELTHLISGSGQDHDLGSRVA